jgi:hypothetical protein
MMASFDHDSQIPRKVLHHIVIGDSIAEGAIITTNSPALRVLGPPVEGGNWIADDGAPAMARITIIGLELSSLEAVR